MFFFSKNFSFFFYSLLYIGMTDHSKNLKVGEFILDSIVPDINVPIMKLSRKKTFNREKWIHKTTA